MGGVEAFRTKLASVVHGQTVDTSDIERLYAKELVGTEIIRAKVCRAVCARGASITCWIKVLCLRKADEFSRIRSLVIKNLIRSAGHAR